MGSYGSRHKDEQPTVRAEIERQTRDVEMEKARAEAIVARQEEQLEREKPQMRLRPAGGDTAKVVTSQFGF